MDRFIYPDQADYEIHVDGHIGEAWSSRFDGLTMETRFKSGGTPFTILKGTVVDQAALHGLVGRIRDLGLTLLLVKRLDRGDEYEGDSKSLEFQ